jgi:5-methylcytosine-specific restriction protein A
MPTRPPRRCTTPGCPGTPIPGSGSAKCPPCADRARRPRPSSTTQGYDREHETRFRDRVLARDPVCVICRDRSSEHADHWPRSKRELRAEGLDEHNPIYGRGLCHPCHSAETARNQPGGWHAGPAY